MPSARCRACAEDSQFLRQAAPARLIEELFPLQIVDLFSGCGGISLGLVEAARRLGRGAEIALATDVDTTALDVLSRHLPVRLMSNAPVEVLFDGELGSRGRSRAETRLVRDLGPIDFLVGGPPCQGNSSLNNHTRGSDKRNQLYLRMARAAQVLKPIVVLIENVPTVRHAKGKPVERTTAALQAAGYATAETVIDSTLVGAPQRRKRHLLLAVRERSGIDPTVLLDKLDGPCDHVRSVKWAIDDLKRISTDTTYDSAPTPSKDNAKRIDHLFDNDLFDLPNAKRPKCHRTKKHSYVSVYGRLRADQPAQTVTTGFGSMGQGRYVHPTQRRTITPHEAARLQTFPDWFDFAAVGRTALGRLIGNAVPPLLNLRLGELIINELDRQ